MPTHTTSVYINISEAVPTRTTSVLQLQGLLLRRDPNRALSKFVERRARMPPPFFQDFIAMNEQHRRHRAVK